MIIIVAFLSFQLHHLTLLFKLEINSNFLFAFLAIELVIKLAFVQSNREYTLTNASSKSSLSLSSETYIFSNFNIKQIVLKETIRLPLK